MTNEELYQEERRAFWRECVIASRYVASADRAEFADNLLKEFDARFAPKQDAAVKDRETGE
jgi:hypothetical protein